MSRKRGGGIVDEIGLLLVCTCLCLAYGCSVKEPAPAPAFPASPIQVTTAATYTYPLKISANGRYLVDQNGKPFRIQGDSAQSLIANLTYAEADKYLSDRQKKGFNTVNVNLLEAKFAFHAPANRNGDAPFTKPGDFSTPNEAYFAFADSIIDLAASKGMLVSLAALYLGFHGGDEGWWKALTNGVNTQTVCYNFGLYVGKRYKSRKNIFWVIGGDYLPPEGSEGELRLRRFLEGIKDAGAKQLWAGDWNAPCISTTEKAFAPLMDLNAVYTYGIPGHPGTTYGEAQTAYNDLPARPAYLKETGYENENWIAGDPASVRKYQYWGVLGGATDGVFFGNRDIWEFATASWWSGFHFGHSPWQAALDSAGAFDMTRLGRLLDPLPWYDLVPSGLGGIKKLVTEGGGTFGQSDYVTAAATSDGKVLLAYIPPETRSSSITVDITALKDSARAQWFDPTSGNYLEVSGSPFPNSGTRNFKIPGKNSAGAGDWVLLLQVF